MKNIIHMDLILLFLSTIGLIAILVRSELFKRVREVLTNGYKASKERQILGLSIKLLEKQSKAERFKTISYFLIRLFVHLFVYYFGRPLLWFLDQIFNCELCMSVWAGAACYLFLEYELYFVSYVLSSVAVVYLYFKIADRIEKI